LRRAAALVALGLIAASGCQPTRDGPPPPTTPTPVPGFTASVVVFEDDNANGVQDPEEAGVVPDAEVEIGGQVGTSEEGTGAATVRGVAAGTYTIGLRKLPPFYQPGAPQTITVPGGTALVPLILPISGNTHSVYLAHGDSISQGVPGSSDGFGYRSLLQAKLQAAFRRGDLDYEGGLGGRTDDGRRLMPKSLGRVKPAFTLIDWGVNDWNPIPGAEYDQACQASPDPPDCPFLPNLIEMIDDVRGAGSLPVIATLTPPNTNIAPEGRYLWVLKANNLIRSIVPARQILLADVGAAFIATGHPNDFLTDNVHPNDPATRSWRTPSTRRSRRASPVRLPRRPWGCCRSRRTKRRALSGRMSPHANLKA